jgi:gluconate 2-dehydrogenase gamma chain
VGVEGSAQAPQGEIAVPKGTLPRYGFQGKLTPQQSYREGLKALDQLTNGKHGRPFRELTEEQQDAILTDLEAGKGDTFTDPAADAFFSMLQDDANEGMFADPIYGGNRDLAGWKLIGYPGAQRAYTEQELRHGTNRQPQGLRDMPAMHQGRSGGGLQPIRQAEGG